MRPRSRPRAASASLLFGLAPGGACRAADVAARAVRSCRTLSPLPMRRTLRPAGWAVCFLWRFPWGRPRRTLSGAASVWSPDFPPLRSGGRPADWRKGHMGPGRGGQAELAVAALAARRRRASLRTPYGARRAVSDRVYKAAGPAFIAASPGLWDCAAQAGGWPARAGAPSRLSGANAYSPDRRTGVRFDENRSWRYRWRWPPPSRSRPARPRSSRTPSSAVRSARARAL